MPTDKPLTTADKTKIKQQSAAEAILWAALEKLAKAEYTREELLAGKHQVSVVIAAEVNGEKLPTVNVDTDIQAKVTIQGGGVYHPSVKAPADHLLAILWSYLPETVRLKLATELPQHYDANKVLPEVDETHLAAIDKLTKRLTARGPAKPKAGSINASRI